MESLGRERRRGLEPKEYEGLGKGMKAESEVVAVKEMSPPSPTDSMAASPMNRDLGLRKEGGDDT